MTTKQMNINFFLGIRNKINNKNTNKTIKKYFFNDDYKITNHYFIH